MSDAAGSPSTARDRAAEVVAEGLVECGWRAHGEEGDGAHDIARAAITSLCANPGVLRALAGEAEPTPAVPTTLPDVRLAPDGSLWRSLGTRWAQLTTYPSHHDAPPADAVRLVPAGGSAPADEPSEDRRALDDIAELCGARRGDHRTNVVMVVRSMLQDPAMHNARRWRALAVVGRLVCNLEALTADWPDAPSVEALGALDEARRFLNDGGGSAPHQGATADVSARLRAAHAAGTAVAEPMYRRHPIEAEQAASWVEALLDLEYLADVLQPPHDPVAAAIVRALLGAGETTEATDG